MEKLLAQKIILPNTDVAKGQSDFVGFSNFRFNNLGDVITGIIPFVFAFAGMGLLIMLLLGGFSLLMSAGDAKKLEKGKQTLTYAILGFLIIFVAYWLVQILGAIFGLGEITNIFR